MARKCSFCGESEADDRKLLANESDSSFICEFCVDTVDEVELLPTTNKKASGKFATHANFKMYPPIGSTCIVGNGTEEVLVYMLFSNGWKQM